MLTREKTGFLQNVGCSEARFRLVFHFALVFSNACASLPPLQLGGCGILGVGVWLSVTQGNFATLSSSLPSLSAANLLIAVGAIIMVIGCLGCVGAVKESRPLLLTVNHFEGGVLDLDTPPHGRRRRRGLRTGGCFLVFVCVREKENQLCLTFC